MTVASGALADLSLSLAADEFVRDGGVLSTAAIGIPSFITNTLISTRGVCCWRRHSVEALHHGNDAHGGTNWPFHVPKESPSFIVVSLGRLYRDVKNEWPASMSSAWVTPSSPNTVSKHRVP